MDPAAFDPANAGSWLARGRTPEHAAALAKAWRDYPDLPPGAPLAAREARGRQRIVAMRPVDDAIRAHGEAQRQATNFAFLENQVREGKATERDLAILRGRDQHNFDWDVCNLYADGWYAAHVGWPHTYRTGVTCSAPLEVRRAAYDQGFTDGGGDRTDLFDAARRANLAVHRRSNMPPVSSPILAARPLPSSWAKPGDEARPARWSRRLAIISAADITGDDPARARWDFLRLIRERPGAHDLTVLVLTNHGFVDAERHSGVAPSVSRKQIDAATAAQQIRDAIVGREFDDVLVALPEGELGLLDAAAGAIPLCRTMERTRNTELQRRAHLRTWLDRGYGADENMAAGHIRWGKLIQGLTGKLGEFTARHVGPAPTRGHLILVEIGDGSPAHGYADASGAPLAAEIVVSSKARLRSEMAHALRRFGAATPLMALPTRKAA